MVFSSSDVASPSFGHTRPSSSSDESANNHQLEESNLLFPGNHALHSAPAVGALTGSYRRPAGIVDGASGRPSMLSSSPSVAPICLTREELDDIEREERKLLKDNKIIPSYGAVLHDRSQRPSFHEDVRRPLLANEAARTDAANASNVEEELALAGKWEDAVMGGLIQTTWKREAKVLTRYSLPLMVTFTLQYSLTTASVLAAGNLGKNELAAVSLAGMTASITGYAVFQGLATSLDTLCAQAYGAGKKELVGLHLQRMVYFLLLVSIPVSMIWVSSGEILSYIIPERELALLAGSYLQILTLGLPGYAVFEAGKRYTQAQGLFGASTWVLLISAPTNAILNYILVWHPRFGIGFAGAPTAVVITDYLMPLLLFLYVRYIKGSECWGGFSRKALTNWGPMIKLSLPGLIMILAEFMAFEILTLMASYFSTAHLAAQSVISTTCAFTYQIPFALSIASSTRVANFVGATLGNAAKTAAYTGLVFAVVQGFVNAVVLYAVKNHLPKLFTADPEVIELVATVLPLAAAFQLVDGVAAMAAGVLRGQGRQYIGGYVNLVAYYVLALPLSMFLSFVWDWELFGLWMGVSIALCLVALVESIVILKSNWQKIVDSANDRNNSG